MKVAIVNLSHNTGEELVVEYDNATFIVPRGKIHYVGNSFPRTVELSKRVRNGGRVKEEPQLLVSDFPESVLEPGEGPEM